MNDIIIFKTTNHMDDGITLTDICQELVTKSLTLRCTLYQTCDINKLDGCWDGLLTVIHVCQNLQALIRYRYDTYIGINCCEWVVGSKCACLS